MIFFVYYFFECWDRSASETSQVLNHHQSQILPRQKGIHYPTANFSFSFSFCRNIIDFNPQSINCDNSVHDQSVGSDHRIHFDFQIRLPIHLRNQGPIKVYRSIFDQNRQVVIVHCFQIIYFMVGSILSLLVYLIHFCQRELVYWKISSFSCHHHFEDSLNFWNQSYHYLHFNQV